jgi:hypothetical protein
MNDFMQDIIGRFLNPDSYSAQVVEEVRQVETAKLTTSWGIVRLCFELRNNDVRAAEVIINQLMKEPPFGYELFQLTTARMIIARQKNDNAAFVLALDAWLKGRRKTPQNWDDRVLEEISFQGWLADVDPKKLKPRTVRGHKISGDDISFVKHAAHIPLKAVLENLEWLREMKITETPEEIAQTYKLFSLNRHLREASFESTKGFPGITVALDEGGNFTGSFLAH